MRFQVCTIITRSYLPQARVLYDSFRRFHPDIPFHALVFDARPGEVDEPFNILHLDDIGLPAGEEKRMPMLYNVTELATAIKPWFFRQLLSRKKTGLLYFDPDIEIFAPVDHLADLTSKHCLVLTPHTTRPMSRDANVKPNETDILSAGTYNLGFLGLNPDCGTFLDWWSERLLREAVIDIPNMRFTDQRWMDFAPGYFETHILRDETCNVAYWNADSRQLTWTGVRYEVNGQPLCFFHFSGFKPEKPHLLSFHQHHLPRTRLSQHPALTRLCQEYAAKLASAGYDQLGHSPYGWGKLPNGMSITPPMRIAYRLAVREQEEKGAPSPPLGFDDPDAFIAWLNEPFHPRQSPEITRFMGAIFLDRRDIRNAFPIVPGRDSGDYYHWLRTAGRDVLQIPDELFPARSTDTEPTLANETVQPSRGITLTGYLRAEAGTGEAARLVAKAVEAAGEKLMTQIWTDAPSRQNHPWANGSTELHHDYDTNLICINADQLPKFAAEVGPRFFQNRYNIGIWFWEVEVFPQKMWNAFDYVQEVWVASDFVRDAIANSSSIPVVTVPLPLNINAPRPVVPSRAALKLPDGFMFLFCFDFFSVAERKNPVGAIEAFKRAFAPGEGPILVIKSINGSENLAELERLHYARGDRADIIIRDGYLSATERDELMAACDCYVSLHRSEGFGLTIAEAMLLEKPAIATRYSGNLQFMNDGNSFLCGYNLRPVGGDCSPYPADANWADPNVSEAAQLMRLVYQDPGEAQRRAKQARRDLLERHDPSVAGEFMKDRLSALRQNPPPFAAPVPSASERPAMKGVRSELEHGVDVRGTVPSLLTWILKGPRRAMKRFLTAYDQHLRRIGLITLDAVKEVDVESFRERTAIQRRLDAQENELNTMRQELRNAQQRVAAMERELGKNPSDPETPRAERSSTGQTIRRKNGAA